MLKILEIDYLGDKDFEAIYAISLEAPQRIGVMCASTPTGRRGKFYSLCTEMKTNQEVPLLANDKTRFDTSYYDRSTATGWKEFHFPTMVNPEWDDAMEEELRSMYSQAAFEHEVLAEFGTESLGVFNKEFIDEACSNGYPLLSYPKIDSPIVCGIDWDKYGNATQIVITQWNPLMDRREGCTGHGRFQVINRVEIPKGEFTYDVAVHKIVELDSIYNFAFIYADRGSGN